MKKYINFAAFSIFALILGLNVVAAQGFNFTRDLSAGASGEDVSSLQSWLISNGFDIPSISSGVSSKGYFGNQTRAALIRYQQSIGFPAFGFFGPMTRGRLNGGDSRGNSLVVTSPNGGENWQIGTNHQITWTVAPGLANQSADIKLSFPTPACAEPSQPIRCMIMVRAPLTIATVFLNSGSYAWNVGTVRKFNCVGDPLPMECASASGGVFTTSDLGQYKIEICPSYGSQCDTSDAYFNITSSQTTGNIPGINGIDAPTTLTVGQTGTWTVRATDPMNGTLSYSAVWGDLGAGYAGISSGGIPLQQTSTFTHSYSAVGTYTVTFTVRNSSGQTAQTSSTVNVMNNTGAGPLQITSPNGGETWVKGTTQTIRWTSPYYIRATYADIRLVGHRTACAPGYVCTAVMPTQYTIASNISINQNSYTWSVGDVQQLVPPTPYGMYSSPDKLIASDGEYTIQICEVSSNNCDSSDGPFTIKSSQVTPTITVTSPNGGEVWQANTSQPITWSYPAATVNSKVDLSLLSWSCPSNIYVGAPCMPKTIVLDKNIAANSTYNWIVATDINNNQISPGNYLVSVCVAGTNDCGSSKNSFTITSGPSIYCPPGYICTPRPY